jgi:putative FmdB family regulatory protein
MPMYEYKCDECGRVFSELRKIADREKPIDCPDCGGKGRVIMSTFAGGGSSSDACPINPSSSCTSGFG